MGLSSYPSSGNTWLRYLIEGTTGYFTGSMYNDVTLSNKGFYGEGVHFQSQITVAIKSHGYTTGPSARKILDEPESTRMLSNHFKELNSTAILLIRNPFKAIIGHRHLDEGGHTGHASPKSFVGRGWNHFVSVKIRHWEYFYTDWIKSKEAKILVVHFENLIDNLEWNLLRILDFLDFESDQQRLQCVLRNAEGQFHRRAKNSTMSQTSDDPYNDSQKKLIREAVRRVDQALKMSSMEAIPIHKYEFYR